MNNTNETEEKVYLSNRYSLQLSFPDCGLTISDNIDSETESISQRNIVYTEVCNFFNRRFPARLLTVTMKGSELLKLLSTRNKLINNKETYFNIDIISKGTMNGTYSQIAPVKLGSFKCTLKNNEVSSQQFVTEDQANKIVDGNPDNTMTVIFNLFRETELSFGLNSNINFLSTGANLSTIFAHGKASALPKLRSVVSKFDHNPVVPRLLIPTLSFTDFVTFLDDEFGLYYNGYSMFVEEDILYFLNKELDPKVTVKSLDYSILLDVARESDKRTDNAYVNNNDTKTAKLKVVCSDLQISVNNSNIMRNSPIYISPKGNVNLSVNSTGRDVDTIRKITEIPHLVSRNTLQYEYITFTVQDKAIAKINPLTKLNFIDSTSNNRQYRIYFKSISIKSCISTITTLGGFRTLDKSQ